MPTSAGFIALRIGDDLGTDRGYTLDFVSTFDQRISRLDISTGMFTPIDDSLLESTVAEKSFTDIPVAGVVQIEGADGWDSDSGVWFSATATREDGGALHATFNLPKGADALPTEEVASLGGPAVVFRADWTARQSPTVQETRPPRRGTLHMLPGDATDEEINAVVRAIRGEDEPGG